MHWRRFEDYVVFSAVKVTQTGRGENPSGRNRPRDHGLPYNVPFSWSQ